MRREAMMLQQKARSLPIHLPGPGTGKYSWGHISSKDPLRSGTHQPQCATGQTETGRPGIHPPEATPWEGAKLRTHQGHCSPLLLLCDRFRLATPVRNCLSLPAGLHPFPAHPIHSGRTGLKEEVWLIFPQLAKAKNNITKSQI